MTVLLEHESWDGIKTYQTNCQVVKWSYLAAAFIHHHMVQFSQLTGRKQ
jgi:hypothetical protein